MREFSSRISVLNKSVTADTLSGDDSGPLDELVPGGPCVVTQPAMRNVEMVTHSARLKSGRVEIVQKDWGCGLLGFIWLYLYQIYTR